RYCKFRANVASKRHQAAVVGKLLHAGSSLHRPHGKIIAAGGQSFAAGVLCASAVRCVLDSKMAFVAGSDFSR
ncbi:MAG: hypothetical protein KDA75_10410, partial [Planctomycetaceae bacterium]|nr:hypothetical protein [Planctomycetaceae bacterium]